MGVIVREDLARYCIVEFHYIENGLDPSLSAEPYTYLSPDKGITVAVIVIIIWYKVLYKGGMVRQRYNHGGNMK